jgi:hypothetical protein
VCSSCYNSCSCWETGFIAGTSHPRSIPSAQKSKY